MGKRHEHDLGLAHDLRVMSRRRALWMFGAAAGAGAAAVAAGCATDSATQAPTTSPPVASLPRTLVVIGERVCG
ncbi:hypothetical protein [Nocardia cyriacigeorgica]|uniref:hypothetical protein n=1 Tax=Nocardia cyriacigeorgica TaxID=135487 RepID=UPI002453B082|nr:hypothetical protein [Nocardia cyriacigeorgica]